MDAHPEQLLDHGHLLRALAGALVHSDADVDDVVQGTLAAALTTRRPAGFALSAWLAGTARNLARRQHRDRSRRNRRELAAAQPEAIRSTAEVVELEELRGRVVAAVLALDEPYRSVVLLRYYDGLPPRAIARRRGCPAATVRSQLHRALELLRQRLDRDQRGGRAAWTALLLPLAPSRPVAQGAISMTVKITAAALLTATAALLYTSLHTPPPEPQTSTTAAAPAPTTATGPTVDAAPRERLAPNEQGPGPAAARGPVEIRFVDEIGATVAGVAMQQQFATAHTAPTAMLLDTEVLERAGIDGWLATLVGPTATWQKPCTLTFAGDGATLPDLPERGSYRLVIARPAAAPHVTERFTLPADAPRTFAVPLPPATARRTVRLVADDTGTVLADATITAFAEFGDDRAFVPGTTTSTDARGECVLATAEPANPELIRPAVWWLMSPTHAGRFSVQPGEGALEVRIPRRGVVEGTAFAPTGQPAAGCTIVVASNKGPRSEGVVAADGRYRIDAVPATRGLLGCIGPDGRIDASRAREISVGSGATTRQDLGSPNPGATVQGRITSGGRPLAGVTVLAQSRGERRTATATTDADGRFALGDVPEKASFALLLGDPTVSDDFTVRREAPLDAAALAQPFDYDLPAGIVRVQVVDATTHAPLAGVRVTARPTDASVQADRFAGHRYRAGWAQLSDAEGFAALRCMPEGQPLSIRVGGGGYETKVIDLPSPGLDAEAAPLVVAVAKK